MPALYKWYGDSVKGKVNKEVQDAIKRVINLMRREAMQGCPVLTGRLRSSTSINWSGSGLTKGEVGSQAKPDDGVGQPPMENNIFVGVMGTNVEYARRIELGFVGTDKLGRSYNQAPRPYLRKAYEHHKDWRKQIRPVK